MPVVSPDIAALSPLPSLQTPAPTKQKSATKSNHTARKILVGLLILVVLVGGSMLGLNLARKDITGTWSGPSFYNGTANGEIDTYTLTQSGASITGTGYVTDMSSQVSLSVTGSINFYFVTLHAFADGCNNLTLTLTLSLDSNTMSGSALSLCNSTGTFTITLTRK